ncbi:hypothetical protein [Nesterenkonia muleiensis]|uniref:hypothetical protein n=1 Tax=Nesterenkonia muleiensis TaxID=2282648 RepID=UPI001300AE2F|nr:hypothetical protein [Nesterenkonia muleiensis]
MVLRNCRQLNDAVQTILRSATTEPESLEEFISSPGEPVSLEAGTPHAPGGALVVPSNTVQRAVLEALTDMSTPSTPVAR